MSSLPVAKTDCDIFSMRALRSLVAFSKGDRGKGSEISWRFLLEIDK
jgi:hypothetical protein